MLNAWLTLSQEGLKRDLAAQKCEDALSVLKDNGLDPCLAFLAKVFRQRAAELFRFGNVVQLVKVLLGQEYLLQGLITLTQSESEREIAVHTSNKAIVEL